MSEAKPLVSGVVRAAARYRYRGRDDQAALEQMLLSMECGDLSCVALTQEMQRLAEEVRDATLAEAV